MSDTLSQKHWLPTTPPVSAMTFSNVIKAHPVVVIHFWADWNGYDRKMDALLQELRPKYEAKITFFSFDTTPKENLGICHQYQIRQLPALVCFIEGVQHETLIGMRSKSDLETKFKTWVAAAKAKSGEQHTCSACPLKSIGKGFALLE